MHARTCNVLALALSAALLSPLAMAQQGGKPQPTPPPTDVAAQPHDIVPDAPMAVQKLPKDALRMRSDAELAAKVRTPQRDHAADADDTAPALDGRTQAQAQAHAAAPSKVSRDTVFDTLDGDGDGSISSIEAEADLDFQARFGTIDSDGDGIVTDAEYKLFAKTQVPSAQPGQAQGAVHAAGHSSVVQRGTFAPLDADADGRISLEEAGANADFAAGFEMMDSDGDGFVSDAEFRAHAKAGGDATP